jgi:hypothetical protein
MICNHTDTGGIKLSYRPARLHTEAGAGRYDKPMPESTTYTSIQGLKIWLKHSRTVLHATDKRERDRMRRMGALIWYCADVCEDLKQSLTMYYYDFNVLNEKERELGII